MRYLKKTLCAALAAMMILMGTSCDVLMAPANPEEVTEKTPTGNHPSESTPGEADSVGGNPAETAPSESEKGEETEEVTIKEEITEEVTTVEVITEEVTTVEEITEEVTTAHVHAETVVEGVAPTCTETGLTEGVLCGECGEVLVEQETIPAVGHTPGADATCTEPQNCTVCGEMMNAANGHIPGAPANCTMAQTCTVCHIELAPALGHTEVICPAVAPTCTATGLTEGKKCSECGEVIVAQNVVAAQHDYRFENTCAVCGDYADKGVVFTLSGNEYSVTDYTGYASEVIIPSIYKGYPVTSIGDYAFQSCSSLASIEIPDSVTSIGHAAFSYCTSLTSMEIPDSVTSIGNVNISGGDDVFSYCTSLETVVIGAGVKFIRGSAFDHCDALTSITVDENNEYFKSIDGNLYTKNAETLKKYAIGKTDAVFTIPDGVTSIGADAVANCNSLTRVVIPNSVTRVSGYAFYQCSKLRNVNIPEGVTHIGERAFEGCTSLESMTLPESLESLGYLAFSDCDMLTSVIIPANVSSYEESFISCDNLAEIDVDEKNEHFVSIDGILYTKDRKTLLQYANGRKSGDFIIPDGVTTISNNAFRDCTTLVNITIPASVTEIKSVFYRCTSLQNFTVDENNECFSSIDGNLYDKNATRLIKFALGKFSMAFEIPKSVSAINSHAFAGAKDLYCVEIHKGITDIGVGAFMGSESIWISVDEDNPYYKAVNGNLYSKDGKTLIQYLSRHTSSTFSIPDSVTSIDAGAFANNQILQEVIINSNIIIETSAFYFCTNLESIVLPQKTIIDNYTFDHCDALTSVYYKGNIENNELFVYTSGNSSFRLATVYYYSEVEPAIDGDFWHYDKNGKIVVW